MAEQQGTHPAIGSAEQRVNAMDIGIKLLKRTMNEKLQQTPPASAGAVRMQFEKLIGELETNRDVMKHRVSGAKLKLASQQQGKPAESFEKQTPLPQAGIVDVGGNVAQGPQNLDIAAYGGPQPAARGGQGGGDAQAPRFLTDTTTVTERSTPKIQSFMGGRFNLPMNQPTTQKTITQQRDNAMTQYQAATHNRANKEFRVGQAMQFMTNTGGKASAADAAAWGEATGNGNVVEMGRLMDKYPWLPAQVQSAALDASRAQAEHSRTATEQLKIQNVNALGQAWMMSYGAIDSGQMNLGKTVSGGGSSRANFAKEAQGWDLLKMYGVESHWFADDAKVILPGMEEAHNVYNRWRAQNTGHVLLQGKGGELSDFSISQLDGWARDAVSDSKTSKESYARMNSAGFDFKGAQMVATQGGKDSLAREALAQQWNSAQEHADRAVDMVKAYKQAGIRVPPVFLVERSQIITDWEALANKKPIGVLQDEAAGAKAAAVPGRQSILGKTASAWKGTMKYAPPVWLARNAGAIASAVESGVSAEVDRTLADAVGMAVEDPRFKEAKRQGKIAQLQRVYQQPEDTPGHVAIKEANIKFLMNEINKLK